MTDIVERLRGAANGLVTLKTELGDYGLCDEAATEITRLRDKVAKADELAEALHAIRQTIETLSATTHGEPGASRSGGGGVLPMPSPDHEIDAHGVPAMACLTRAEIAKAEAQDAEELSIRKENSYV